MKGLSSKSLFRVQRANEKLSGNHEHNVLKLFRKVWKVFRKHFRKVRFSIIKCIKNIVYKLPDELPNDLSRKTFLMLNSLSGYLYFLRYWVIYVF